jgi:hypothetical protein
LLLLFGFSLLSVLLVASLAVDMGAAYVTSSNLSKAADAGALAGARYTMMGEAAMRDVIQDVAEANFGVDADASMNTSFDIDIWSPAVDTTRVRVAGSTDSPSFFARLFGVEEIPVQALAEATRYPLDMSLVLDLSASLDRADAFDDMQNAAKAFLDYFDDNIDRFGLVTYSTWAEQKMPVQKNFKAAGKTIVDGLSAISDTNIEEGLRLAKVQLDAAAPRTQALKMVVLFTDGRPTATRGNQRMKDGTNPLWYDGIVASYISGSSFRGLFHPTSGLKVRRFTGGVPEFEPNSSTNASPVPKHLTNNAAVNGDNIRALGIVESEEWAAQLRAAGYTVFSIGLGNPNAQYEADTPDLEFLRRLANEDGMVNGDQPQGEMLFAPTPVELTDAFATLADRIITRLTR